MKTLMLIPKILLICSLLSLASCVDEETVDDALNLSNGKLKLSISPKNADISVATNLNTILLTFDSKVAIETAKQVIQSKPQIAYHLDTSRLKDSNLLTIILDEKLQPSTEYTFLIKDVKNLSTEKLESFAWEYTTVANTDTRAPELVSTLPLDSAVDVSDLLDQIVITFDENIKLAAFKDFVIFPAVTGTMSIIGNKLVFKPQAALTPNENYRVTLNNISDLSGNTLSSEVAINFSTVASNTPLSIPTLKLTSSANSTSPSFSWNAAKSSSGISYYKIKKGVTIDRIPTFDTLSNSTFSYTDSGLKTNRTYYYQLKISDNAGNIVRSNIIKITTADKNSATPPIVDTNPGKDTTLPSIPTLKLTSASNSTSPSFSWNAAKDASGIAYYKIKKGFSRDNISTFDTLSNSTLSYTDSGLETNRTYYYQLKISDNAGNIVRSNIIKITTANQNSPVPPPASVIPGPTKALTLTWSSPTRNSDNSCLTNLQGYNIDFKTSASGYKLLKKLTLDSTQLNCTIDTKNPDTTCGNATICTYQTTELAAGTWFFKVQAINNQGSTSPDSNEVSSQIN